MKPRQSGVPGPSGVLHRKLTFIEPPELTTIVSTGGGAPEIPSYPVPWGIDGPACLPGTSI